MNITPSGQKMCFVFEIHIWTWTAPCPQHRLLLESGLFGRGVNSSFHSIHMIDKTWYLPRVGLDHTATRDVPVALLCRYARRPRIAGLRLDELCASPVAKWFPHKQMNGAGFLCPQTVLRRNCNINTPYSMSSRSEFLGQLRCWKLLSSSPPPVPLRSGEAVGQVSFIINNSLNSRT